MPPSNENGPSPWSGVTLIEVGETVAVAAATKRFADFGADVIKVESPARDEIRRVPPFADDRPHIDSGGFHLALDSGKRSVVIDHATASGREILERLGDRSGLVFVDFPPASSTAACLAPSPLDDDRSIGGAPRRVTAGSRRGSPRKASS